MSNRVVRRRAAPSSGALVLALALASCGRDDAKSAKTTQSPSPAATCEVPASFEKTPDDEDKIGDAADRWVTNGPCIVSAAKRWFASHPTAASDGSPIARVVLRAVGQLIASLTGATKDEALDVLLDAEMNGDSSVRRDALAGLETVRTAVSARIEDAWNSGDESARARARLLIDALGLPEPKPSQEPTRPK